MAPPRPEGGDRPGDVARPVGLGGGYLGGIGHVWPGVEALLSAPTPGQNLDLAMAAASRP